MKIIFMGTSEFAVPSLTKLINSGHNLIEIISQPDRPKGRGKKILPTPVKKVALDYNLPVYQPVKIKHPDAVKHICSLDVDCIVVASYGQIIPAEILNLPRFGCINVHASLLPEFRGAAPIQRAIMAGKKVTGITTMYMDEGLDTGDIIMQKEISIEDDMDHGTLESVLAESGADLLLDTLKALENGSAVRIPQDNSKASYAQMITRDDEIISWSHSAETVHNTIRALCPKPGAYTTIAENKIKIFKSRVVNTNGNGVVGQINSLTSEGFVVQTGAGLLEILEIQKAGKKRMSSSDFLKGFKLEPGTLIGDQGI
ncbi:MAG: methionyl-tRNA formyltransferase [Syntrophomonadaceae bacterium]|nr:methionyl-tRNA formyltransferase [Syntrophomonadaceae bacterium]MDD3888334.1 methionyl-tRNA formyltransferase [Syntrophomonadaceae bacterium]MDD4548841.1 methionyl-tRNA formyltransferase [Syntrophomonadaceae bacterium]